MKLSKMRVVDLRKELRQRGLDEKGNRPSLMKRLRDAIEDEKNTTGGHSHDDRNASISHDAQPTQSNSKPKFTDNGQKKRIISPREDEGRLNRKSTEKAQKGTHQGQADERRRYRRDKDGFDDEQSTLDANTRRNASPVQNQHRDASDEDEKARKPMKSEDQASIGAKMESNEAEVNKDIKTGTDSEISTPEKGSKNSTQNGKPRNASHSPSKVNVIYNIQRTRDTPTDERMRRRQERFGTVEKTETTGNLPEDEAIIRRRERFGVVSSPKTAEESGADKTVKSAENEAEQQQLEAAKRRRALKFGLTPKKRSVSDNGIPPEEVEKRLKRQRRFQNVY